MIKLKRAVLLLLAMTSLFYVACKSTDVKAKPEQSQESGSSKNKKSKNKKGSGEADASDKSGKDTKNGNDDVFNNSMGKGGKDGSSGSDSASGVDGKSGYGKDRNGSGGSSGSDGADADGKTGSGKDKNGRDGSSDSDADGKSGKSGKDSSSGKDGSGKDGSGKDGKGTDGKDGKNGKGAPAVDYDALLKRLESSRESALKAGADDALPDVFRQADALYEAQKALVAEGKASEETADILKNLNDLYEGLSLYSSAKEKKERIDRNGYASHNQKAYDDGSALLDMLSGLENLAAQLSEHAAAVASGDKNGKAGAGTDFLKKARQADQDFMAVFKSASANERSAALKAKKQADSVKASVSRKSDYDTGVNDFRLGDTNYVTGSVEASIANYIDSKLMFSKLYAEISKLREKALRSLDAAQRRVEQSGDNALRADRTAPLTEKIEGIEDADAKLLQDDDFTEAENSFVELEEELSGGSSL